MWFLFLTEPTISHNPDKADVLSHEVYEELWLPWQQNSSNMQCHESETYMKFDTLAALQLSTTLHLL